MPAARKLDNITTARDARASAGRSAEIILLDAHRPSHADNAIGRECAIPAQALDHIGADMTPEAAAKARAERHRRQRVELRRRMFARIEQRSTMGLSERIGHEMVIRVGVVGIIGVLVAMSRGWI